MIGIKSRFFKRDLIILAMMVLGLVQLKGMSAANYYADPENGSMAGNGTQENPWGSLEEVFSTGALFEPGDTIFLMSGHHGTVIVSGINSDYVTILPFEDQQPTLKRVTFSSAEKWKLLRIVISPETATEYNRTTLLEIDGTSTGIVIDSCYFYSVIDNTLWGAGEWSGQSCFGAVINGNSNILRYNHFLNLYHGIQVVDGQHNLIQSNVIENFAGDGIRGLGDYNTYEYNTVKNCYDVDENHDDGFQSWSVGAGGVGTGTVKGLILRGNKIINYTDPAQPFRGTLQGMGCFDGIYEAWIVENNIIITDHWHGITLMGAKDCKIVNNTVVDRNSESPGPPWISITRHKDGTLGTGNIIRNNLTTSLSNDEGIGTVEYNIIVDDYDKFFVDYENLDLRLLEGCPAIDAGTDKEAPFIDIEGITRPQGSGYDVGAYEYPAGPDVIAPVILSVSSSTTEAVNILFSERLDEVTATNSENYAIDQGVVVIESFLSPDLKNVTLLVAGLTDGITYTLTVNHITDPTGNVIEEDTRVTFEHSCGSVTASTSQPPNYPENTLDGDLNTRWSAEGVQWIKYDLCVMHTISSLEMAFYLGNTRTTDFSVEVSADDLVWQEVYSGSSSGKTVELEMIDFPDIYGRYLRINGTGNSQSNWNSYTETVIHAEKLIIDRTELSDSVDAANALHDAAVEGDGREEYPPGSKAILKSAIDSAQAVLDMDSSSQAEISAAYVMLITAMDDFEAGMITVIRGMEAYEIRVFPNPFEDQIRVELPAQPEIGKICIYDLAGRKYSAHMAPDHTLHISENLPSGVYLLRIQTDQWTVNKMIIKQ